MNDAIMIIIMKNSNDFQVHRCIECMRELEAADIPQTKLLSV